LLSIVKHFVFNSTYEPIKEIEIELKKPYPLDSSVLFLIFFTGWINSFLSWEGFEPLSRLSFIIYLVHITIIEITDAQISYPLHLSHMFAVSLIISMGSFPLENNSLLTLQF